MKAVRPTARLQRNPTPGTPCAVQIVRLFPLVLLRRMFIQHFINRNLRSVIVQLGERIMLLSSVAPSPQSSLDTLIGRLYEAPPHCIHSLIAELSPRECGELALFCYGRAHLRHIGLALAASCDHDWLIESGNTAAGDALFDLSRQAPQSYEQVLPGVRRTKISLAQRG